MYSKRLPGDWGVLKQKDGTLINLYDTFNREFLEKNIDISNSELGELLREHAISLKDTEELDSLEQLLSVGKEILTNTEKRKNYDGFLINQDSEKYGKEILKLAKVYATRGYSEKALEEYQKIVNHINYKKNPDILSTAYFEAGVIKETQGEEYSNLEALQCYNLSLRYNPKNHRAHLNLGFLTLENGEYKIAKNHFLNVLKSDQYCIPAIKGMKDTLEGLVDDYTDELERCNIGLSYALNEEGYMREKKKLYLGEPKQKWYEKLFGDLLSHTEIDPWYWKMDSKHRKIYAKLEDLMKKGKYGEAVYKVELLGRDGWLEIAQKEEDRGDGNKKDENPNKKNLRFISNYYYARVLHLDGKLEEAKSFIDKSLEEEISFSKAWLLKKTIITDLISKYRKNIESTDSRISIANSYHRMQVVKQKLDECKKEARDKLKQKEDIGLTDIVKAELEYGLKATGTILKYLGRSLVYGWLPGDKQKQIAEENGDDPSEYTKCTGFIETVSGLGIYFMGVTTLNLPLSLAGVSLFSDGLYRFGKEGEDETCGILPLELPWWAYDQAYKKYLSTVNHWKGEITDNDEVHKLESLVDEEEFDSFLEGRDDIKLLEEKLEYIDDKFSYDEECEDNLNQNNKDNSID